MDGRMLAENYDGMMITIEQAYNQHVQSLRQHRDKEFVLADVLFELESLRNTIDYDLEKLFKRTT
jgi:hypothetical protein